jgi:hypothetical protein
MSSPTDNFDNLLSKFDTVKSTYTEKIDAILTELQSEGVDQRWDYWKNELDALKSQNQTYFENDEFLYFKFDDEIRNGDLIKLDNSYDKNKAEVLENKFFVKKDDFFDTHVYKSILCYATFKFVDLYKKMGLPLDNVKINSNKNYVVDLFYQTFIVFRLIKAFYEFIFYELHKAIKPTDNKYDVDALSPDIQNNPDKIFNDFLSKLNNTINQFKESNDGNAGGNSNYTKLNEILVKIRDTLNNQFIEIKDFLLDKDSSINNFLNIYLLFYFYKLPDDKKNEIVNSCNNIFIEINKLYKKFIINKCLKSIIDDDNVVPETGTGTGPVTGPVTGSQSSLNPSDNNTDINAIINIINNTIPIVSNNINDLFKFSFDGQELKYSFSGHPTDIPQGVKDKGDGYIAILNYITRNFAEKIIEDTPNIFSNTQLETLKTKMEEEFDKIKNKIRDYSNNFSIFKISNNIDNTTDIYKYYEYSIEETDLSAFKDYIIKYILYFSTRLYLNKNFNDEISSVNNGPIATNLGKFINYVVNNFKLVIDIFFDYPFIKIPEILLTENSSTSSPSPAGFVKDTRYNELITPYLTKFDEFKFENPDIIIQDPTQNNIEDILKANKIFNGDSGNVSIFNDIKTLLKDFFNQTININRDGGTTESIKKIDVMLLYNNYKTNVDLTNLNNYYLETLNIYFKSFLTNFYESLNNSLNQLLTAPQTQPVTNNVTQPAHQTSAQQTLTPAQQTLTPAEQTLTPAEQVPNNITPEQNMDEIISNIVKFARNFLDNISITDGINLNYEIKNFDSNDITPFDNGSGKNKVNELIKDKFVDTFYNFVDGLNETKKYNFFNKIKTKYKFLFQRMTPKFNNTHNSYKYLNRGETKYSEVGGTTGDIQMILFITYFTEIIHIKKYTVIDDADADATKNNLVEFYSYFNRNIKILIYLLFHYPFIEIHKNADDQITSGSSADMNTIKKNSIEEYLNFIKIYTIDNPELDTNLKIAEKLRTNEFINDPIDQNFFTKKIKDIHSYFDGEIEVYKTDGNKEQIKRINFALLYDMYKFDNNANPVANTSNEDAINKIVEDINKKYNAFLKDIFDKFASIIDEILTNPTSGGNIVKRKTRKHRNR